MMNFKRCLVLVVLICFFSTINASEDFKIMDGFNFKLGTKHIIRYDAVRSGNPDKDSYVGNKLPVTFSPKDFAGLSVGLEYFFPISGNLELGLGFEHNTGLSLTKSYVNNALGRDGSRQIETKKYSNTPVYIALKYYFEKNSNYNPYLVGRLGYSFNKIDYSFLYWYYGGVPGQGQEVMLVRDAPVKDLKSSLYLAFGFGFDIFDKCYFEGIYSYTKLCYSNEYPIHFTGALGYFDFVADEEYDPGVHSFNFNIGYKFSSSRFNELKFEGSPLKINGLNVGFGICSSLKLDGELKHAPGFTNYLGEYTYSLQDISFSPKTIFNPSLDIEYVFRFSDMVAAGLGVQYDFQNEYTLSKEYNPSTLNRKEVLSNFNIILPYAVVKLRFPTSKSPEPYLIGRLGYSMVSYDYNKIQAGTDLERGGAKDIRGGRYFGLGFGVKFTQHLYSELIYGFTRTAWDVKYYEDYSGTPYPQVESFETDLKFFHIMFGYNF